MYRWPKHQQGGAETTLALMMMINFRLGFDLFVMFDCVHTMEALATALRPAERRSNSLTKDRSSSIMAVNSTPNR